MNIWWPGRYFPIAQVIWWGESRGWRWHRWQTFQTIFRGSLMLGRLEVRVWR